MILTRRLLSADNIRRYSAQDNSAPRDVIVVDILYRRRFVAVVSVQLCASSIVPIRGAVYCRNSLIYDLLRQVEVQIGLRTNSSKVKS